MDLDDKYTDIPVEVDANILMHTQNRKTNRYCIIHDCSVFNSYQCQVLMKVQGYKDYTTQRKTCYLIYRLLHNEGDPKGNSYMAMDICWVFRISNAALF